MKKRTKAYRPKRVASNNMFLAAQNMAVLTDAERAFLVTPLREAFEAMRSGHCSIEQWELLADAVRRNVVQREKFLIFENPAFFLAAVFLLLTEWFLRRRFNLV